MARAASMFPKNNAWSLSGWVTLICPGTIAGCQMPSLAHWMAALQRIRWLACYGLLGLLPAPSIVFGTAAVTDVAVAQAAQPPQKARISAGAFDGAKFSVVAGSGGVPLNVIEVGDPSLPAILLIHGFRQSYLSWTYQFASDLKTRCHIVAFERGHGNSGSPWQPDAYAQAQPWADDVNAVIKATGLSRPLVVGWSFGGNAAMDFARYHPEMPLSGYILVATTAGFEKTFPDRWSRSGANSGVAPAPGQGRRLPQHRSWPVH